MKDKGIPAETVSSERSSDQGTEKRPYHSPTFTHFGQVTELTQGDALTLTDGGDGSTISVTIP